MGSEASGNLRRLNTLSFISSKEERMMFTILKRVFLIRVLFLGNMLLVFSYLSVKQVIQGGIADIRTDGRIEGRATK